MKLSPEVDDWLAKLSSEDKAFYATVYSHIESRFGSTVEITWNEFLMDLYVSKK